jgi:hypothetical protein
MKEISKLMAECADELSLSETSCKSDLASLPPNYFIIHKITRYVDDLKKFYRQKSKQLLSGDKNHKSFITSLIEIFLSFSDSLALKSIEWSVQLAKKVNFC